MNDRRRFALALSSLDLSTVERAVAFLWFYRHFQLFEERSITDLADDLAMEGFPRPNITRLRHDLRNSDAAIKGRREGTVRLHLSAVEELDEMYLPLVARKDIEPVSDAVIPKASVDGTRPYLEQIVRQINGCYDKGFYDACAVLCRRITEALIIDVYIGNARVEEIKSGGQFLRFEKMIGQFCNGGFNLSRGTPKTLERIKNLGDTAAHDRTYITQKQDIDDIKLDIRKVLAELIGLASYKLK